MLLVTDVFLLLTQVLLWILVALAARFILLQALPKAFLGSLVLALLVVVTALTFFSGSPGGGVDSGVLGEIWQIISVIFNPLGLVLILLGLVWWDADHKGLNKNSKWLLRVAVVGLILMSLPLVSNFLVQRSELEAIQITRAEPVALPAGAQRVIVLMGQGTTKLSLRPRTQNPPAEQPRRNSSNNLIQPPEPVREGNYGLLASQAQLTDKGDRILYAAQLFRQEAGNSPLLVVSASQYPGRLRKSNDTRESASEANDISRILQTQFGIPGTAILVDPESPTVQASAVNVRKLLEQRQINNGEQLMIVTSALESSRTSLTFQNEFAVNGKPLTVISRPTDFQMVPPKAALENRLQGNDLIERGLRVADFLPSVESLERSSNLLTESLTSLYYFLRGWVRPLRAG
jgi:uncharacterized SAM-binding protein YcdF (DUF218 family)